MEFVYISCLVFIYSLYFLSLFLVTPSILLSFSEESYSRLLSFFFLSILSLSLSLSIVFVHSPTIPPPAHLSVISLPLLFHFFLFLHSSLSDLFIIMPRLISSLPSLPLPNHSPILSPILLSYLSSFFYSILSYKLASLSFYFLLSLLCLSPSLSLSLT